MTDLYILHQEVSRVELAELVNQSTATVGSPWYFVNFTLEKPHIFKEPAAQQTSDWQIATSGGRLFGNEIEVKWQFNSKGCFDLWTMQEFTPTGPSPALPAFEGVAKKYTKVYCIGAWNGSSFIEGRLPKPIEYPLKGANIGDRVFFKAVEYSPSPPNQRGVASRTAGNLLEIIDELNQPRVLAYRLIGMDCCPGERIPHFAGEEE